MSAARHFFVGGGIAAIAGAVLLIRDHGVDGRRIVIFEKSGGAGGSLDGAQVPGGAYIMRGARMFEQNYRCMLDLMRDIPSPDRPGETLGKEFEAFNRENPVPYACIHLRPGGSAEKPAMKVPRAQIQALAGLMVRGEKRLAGLRICDILTRDFFDSRMWLTMSTAFAFQPWHSATEFRRYLHRFLHLAQHVNHHEGIFSTRYNQAESLIEPLMHWLRANNVDFRPRSCVVDAAFQETSNGRHVTALTVNDTSVPIQPDDRVYFTLGSMTDGASCGAPGEPVPAEPKSTPAFDLWRRLAAVPGFGRPEAFAPDPKLTGWQSFTITLPTERLGDHLATLRPPAAPATVIYALEYSPWRASLVTFKQPHFRDQPPGSEVMWGFGLCPDQPGTHCGVTMEQADGAQIIEEIAGHLEMDTATRAHIFEGAQLIGCRMPLITSQFMPRRPGDRPEIRPAGALNYACIGQFVELPADTVFTVEYSVRTAWEAIAALNSGQPSPPPVARPDWDPRVLTRVLAHLARQGV